MLRIKGLFILPVILLLSFMAFGKDIEIENGLVKLCFGEQGFGLKKVEDLQQGYLIEFAPVPMSIASSPSTSISLNIYDLAGRILRAFPITNNFIGSDGKSPITSVVWNGTDDSGEKVTNGIYFCILRVGKFLQTRKLLLLRSRSESNENFSYNLQSCRPTSKETYEIINKVQR